VRAIVKPAPGPGLVMREEPEPTPGEGEILVRVRRTAICGTDLHIWEWDDWAASAVPPPIIVGHEWSGVVEAHGPGARGAPPVGARVSGEGHVPGRRSRASRAGRLHLDPDTRGIGVDLPGAFADLLVLPAANAVPLPDSISDEVGALLDPLGNAVHAALSFDLAGEDVLVTGAGPIGAMAAAVARRAGARHVAITDFSRERLDLAARAADVRPVDLSRETPADAMAELGMREGFDVAIEASGAPGAYAQILDSTVMGAGVALLGLPSAPFEFDWSRAILRALRIKGIYGREIFETWHKAIALLESGLDVSPLITHRMAPERFAEAFALMRGGRCGKVVLDWEAGRA